MSRFTYTAQKSDGETYTGAAEAADRFALYEIVRREGGHITAVEEDASAGPLSMAYWNRKITRVGEYDKILFARNLGAMLSAGLPLSRALSVMQRQSKNIKLSAILEEIGSSVRRGDTLHDALARHPHTFSPIFIAMAKAGEEGGDLPGALQGVADQTERMYLLKKKIRGAMIYPSIIIVAIVGVGYLMMTHVVPTLAQTFAQMNATLPKSTQFVLAMSNFLVHYSLLALAGIIVVIAGLYIAMKSRGGKHAIDFVLLKTPMIGSITQEINAARTCRTLASLLSSGVDVITALGITGEVVQNSYFRAVIKEASAGVSAGEQLSAAFAKHEKLYPAFVGEMMSVGEETGQTNEMLKRLALYYEDEVDRKTKDMSTVIEPFLMIAIGAAVGFFAISMITPIYSLSSVIG